jgi:hypothetical protein
LNWSSTYERKHVTFVCLSLDYFTYHDVLLLNTFTFKLHVIIPYDRIILHCERSPTLLDWWNQHCENGHKAMTKSNIHV